MNSLGKYEVIWKEELWFNLEVSHISREVPRTFWKFQERNRWSLSVRGSFRVFWEILRISDEVSWTLCEVGRNCLRNFMGSYPNFLESSSGFMRRSANFLNSSQASSEASCFWASEHTYREVAKVLEKIPDFPEKLLELLVDYLKHLVQSSELP